MITAAFTEFRKKLLLTWIKLSKVSLPKDVAQDGSSSERDPEFVRASVKTYSDRLVRR